MRIRTLKEDLIFIAALAVCQVINIIAFLTGVMNSISLMLSPIISLVAVLVFRYTVMMVKLIIIAIKYTNKSSNN